MTHQKSNLVGEENFAPPRLQHVYAAKDKRRNTLHFPTIPTECPSAQYYSEVPLSGDGILYSYTVLHFSPKQNKDPVTVLMVDSKEGVRLFGRLEGAEKIELKIGMKVEIKSNINSDEGNETYFFVPKEGRS